MPLLPGKDNVGPNIKELERSGRPYRQALAISLDNARRHPMAVGGSVLPNISHPAYAPPALLRPSNTRVLPHLATGGFGEMPFEAREEARSDMLDQYHPGGLIESDAAGRTDRVPLAVGTDAHVIPADVVSGLGQGNTMNGAKMLQAILGMGPFGTRAEPMRRGSGPPRYPSGSPAALQRIEASGFAHGGTPDTTHIVAAGGEFIVPPDVVRRKGKGSLAKGHRVIDEMIRRVRKEQAKFLKHAPAPKK